MFFLLVIFLPHFTCVWVIVQCFLAVFSLLLLLFLLLFLFLRLLSGCGVFHCKNDSSILLAEKRFANALFNTSCHGIIHNSVFFARLPNYYGLVFLFSCSPLFFISIAHAQSLSFSQSVGFFSRLFNVMTQQYNVMLLFTCATSTVCDQFFGGTYYLARSPCQFSRVLYSIA